MENFFMHIRFKYDVETCLSLKTYCKIIKKLAKQKERLKFLLGCRQNGIIPTHIRNTTTKTKQLFATTIPQQLGKIETNFHLKILNLEIKETNLTLKNLNWDLNKIRHTLKETLNDEEFDKFIRKQKTRYKNFVSNNKQTHCSKLQNLKRKQLEQFNIKYNPSWFVNKTNVNFTEETKWLLSLGSKFAVPVNDNNFSTVNLIADLEQWVQTVSDDRQKDIIRTKITNRILTHKRKVRNNPKEKFILNIYEETKRFLKRYKDDIVITKSDKGNKTVVIYKEEYKKEMEKLLQDKSTYKTMRTDPTQKLLRTNNNLILDLFKQGYITKFEKNKLTSNAATAPRLYGLPKIHKPNIPLRPISSSIEVPCYKLSKHIGGILRNIILDKYNIKNSLELKEKLEVVSLDENEILISLDVVSLFTNIPINLAINNIMAQWSTLRNHTQIPRTHFLKILQFCLNDNNYFIYDKTIFNQTYGMPMGNPLSPTIADIVLDTLLERTTEELREKNVHIKLITKYVDDLFAIIKKSDEKIILETFNKYHNKLKFTIEKEQNGSIPYLDMRIYREHNGIITDWYTKNIASGRLINYHSTQPMGQKTNTAINLIKKVVKISDNKFLQKNITKIKDILLNNNYPQKIITNLIKRATNEESRESRMNKTSGITKFLSLSYIPKLTESKQIKELIDDETVLVAHKANNTISSLFTTTKTKIEKIQQSNVVYEIECVGNDNETCGKVYVGTTKRSLGTRINEHKTDIEKQKYTTALAVHCFEMKHTPNLTDVKILDRERKMNKRFTLESLRIQERNNLAINKKENKDNANANYNLALI